MLDVMQRHGVIEESNIPWSSPIVLFRKKNRDLRFCVDYWKMNFIKKGTFPLPWIDDTLDMLAGAKWFSTLDLKSGYWQVDLHPDNIENLCSQWVKGDGSSQSCPLVPATLQRRLRS
jgi:hypothetical protein